MSIIYLIDYENVSNEALEGIENVNEKDEIVVFYSDGCTGKLRHNIDNLLCSKAPIRFFKTMCGQKNAMDFQLVAYWSRSIQKSPKKRHVIVSGDHGYDSLEGFVEHYGHKYERMNGFNIMAKNNDNEAKVPNQDPDKTAAVFYGPHEKVVQAAMSLLKNRDEAEAVANSVDYVREKHQSSSVNIYTLFTNMLFNHFTGTNNERGRKTKSVYAVVKPYVCEWIQLC